MAILKTRDLLEAEGITRDGRRTDHRRRTSSNHARDVIDINSDMVCDIGGAPVAALAAGDVIVLRRAPAHETLQAVEVEINKPGTATGPFSFAGTYGAADLSKAGGIAMMYKNNSAGNKTIASGLWFGNKLQTGNVVAGSNFGLYTVAGAAYADATPKSTATSFIFLTAPQDLCCDKRAVQYTLDGSEAAGNAGAAGVIDTLFTPHDKEETVGDHMHRMCTNLRNPDGTIAAPVAGIIEREGGDPAVGGAANRLTSYLPQYATGDWYQCLVIGAAVAAAQWRTLWAIVRIYKDASDVRFSRDRGTTYWARTGAGGASAIA